MIDEATTYPVTNSVTVFLNKLLEDKQGDDLSMTDIKDLLLEYLGECEHSGELPYGNDNERPMTMASPRTELKKVAHTLTDFFQWMLYHEV